MGCPIRQNRGVLSDGTMFFVVFKQETQPDGFQEVGCVPDLWLDTALNCLVATRVPHWSHGASKCQIGRERAVLPEERDAAKNTRKHDTALSENPKGTPGGLCGWHSLMSLLAWQNLVFGALGGAFQPKHVRPNGVPSFEWEDMTFWVVRPCVAHLCRHHLFACG